MTKDYKWERERLSRFCTWCEIVFRYDKEADFPFVEVDDGFCRMLGYEREELMESCHERIRYLIYPPDFQRIEQDVLQQLEWSLRATIEITLPSIMPDLLVKGIMAFSLGMLLCWRKFPDAEDTPTTDRWFMPTPLGISMAVLLLLSAAQLFTTNATVALAASLLGSVAFWSFAVQGVSAQNFAMLRAGATRGRRWFLTILMVLFVPILPMFAGCVDQIRDPRGLRDDRHRKDDDFSDF